MAGSVANNDHRSTRKRKLINLLKARPPVPFVYYGFAVKIESRSTTRSKTTPKRFKTCSWEKY